MQSPRPLPGHQASAPRRPHGAHSGLRWNRDKRAPIGLLTGQGNRDLSSRSQPMEISAQRPSYCVRARRLSHLRVLAHALSVFAEWRIYGGT